MSKNDPDFGKLDLDLYTVDSVAKRLGVKRTTVYDAIRAGRLKAVAFGGSSGFRIRHTALVQWLTDAEADRELAHRLPPRTSGVQG